MIKDQIRGIFPENEYLTSPKRKNLLYKTRLYKHTPLYYLFLKGKSYQIETCANKNG